MDSAELLSFFFSPFSRGRLDIHTSCGRSRRSVHCFRYRPFHSAPNTRPLVLSFCRIFTGSSSCTRTYNQLHPLLSLPLTLSHSRTFSHFSLAHFFVCFYALLFRYFFLSSFFFSLFSHLHSRARSCLSCSHIQQHLNIVFSVIIKRNNDNI